MAVHSLKIERLTAHKAQFLMDNLKNLGFSDQILYGDDWDEFSLETKYTDEESYKFKSAVENLINKYDYNHSIWLRMQNN